MPTDAHDDIALTQHAIGVLMSHLRGDKRAPCSAREALLRAHSMLQRLGMRVHPEALGMYVTTAPTGLRPMPRPEIDGMGITVPTVGGGR